MIAIRYGDKFDKSFSGFLLFANFKSIALILIELFSILNLFLK